MGESHLQPAPWDEVVLVCGKCAAKLGRGKKGKSELASELRTVLKQRVVGGRVRVVETGCLDLCPDRGQTIATGATISGSNLLVVGRKATATDVLQLLGLAL